MTGDSWLVLLAGALAAAVAAGMERLSREAFAVAALERENHAGRRIVTGVGTLIPVAVVLVGGILAVARAAELESLDHVKDSVFFTGVLALGFGFLGLLDDVLGAGQSGGFRGHLRELQRGHLTTGMVKWVGGAALATAFIGFGTRGDLSRLITDAAVIALAANVANLLDRRPGRTTKFAVVALIPIVATAAGIADLAGPVVVVAAALGLAPGELRERYMLGDAGVNAVGAAVGWALVVTTTPAGRGIAALVLLALNLASELVSFSAVIERVPGLRQFDQLGRRR